RPAAAFCAYAKPQLTDSRSFHGSRGSRPAENLPRRIELRIAITMYDVLVRSIHGRPPQHQTDPRPGRGEGQAWSFEGASEEPGLQPAHRLPEVVGRHGHRGDPRQVGHRRWKLFSTRDHSAGHHRYDVAPMHESMCDLSPEPVAHFGYPVQRPVLEDDDELRPSLDLPQYHRVEAAVTEILRIHEH